jgi:hypothetical protein
VRGFFGLGVLAAGIVAFVAEPRVLQFASWEHAPDLWLSAHDLRLAALIAASCGLLLVLSAFTLRNPFWSQFDEHWLAVGASLLAAGTLPLLVIRTAENDAGIDVFVPPAYVIVLRAVQVLLVVTAIGAALAAAGLGRRGTVLGIGVGVVFAVLTAAGALNNGLVLLLPLFAGSRCWLECRRRPRCCSSGAGTGLAWERSSTPRRRWCSWACRSSTVSRSSSDCRLAP